MNQFSFRYKPGNTINKKQQNMSEHKEQEIAIIVPPKLISCKRQNLLDLGYTGFNQWYNSSPNHVYIGDKAFRSRICIRT